AHTLCRDVSGVAEGARSRLPIRCRCNALFRFAERARGPTSPCFPRAKENAKKEQRPNTPDDKHQENGGREREREDRSAWQFAGLRAFCKTGYSEAAALARGRAAWQS